MDSFALFGYPLKNSLSPQIYQQFAKSCDIKLTYQCISVESQNFNKALADFWKASGKGANITLPLKSLAYELCQELTPRAQIAQCVNNFYWRDAILWGDNTDGEGFARFIALNHISLSDKRIMILGAGGASKGIIPALLNFKPKALCIVNRTLVNAQTLGKRWQLPYYTYETLEQSTDDVDIIINATSAGLYGLIPALHPRWVKGKTVLDLSYSFVLTHFLEWAKRHQAVMLIDGKGMLIEQAALAFKNWYGIHPPTENVLANLSL